MCGIMRKSSHSHPLRHTLKHPLSATNTHAQLLHMHNADTGILEVVLEALEV